MKRVNKEHITEVVDGYYQRRNFTVSDSDNFSFVDLVMFLPIKRFFNNCFILSY